MTKGGKNLIILGALSIVIAVLTTSVSLLIYHNSGDIYIDRSRPGFLPDEEENNNTEETVEYDFSEHGNMSTEVIDEYVEKLEAEIKAIDAAVDPFSADGLSNERLGIPAE